MRYSPWLPAGWRHRPSFCSSHSNYSKDAVEKLVLSLQPWKYSEVMVLGSILFLRRSRFQAEAIVMRSKGLTLACSSKSHLRVTSVFQELRHPTHNTRSTLFLNQDCIAPLSFLIPFFKVCFFNQWTWTLACNVSCLEAVLCCIDSLGGWRDVGNNLFSTLTVQRFLERRTMAFERTTESQ